MARRYADNKGIDKIKEIANKITEERNNYFLNPLTPIAERIETYAEDETYEVNGVDGNTIIGCNIAVGDLEFIVRMTMEKELFEIYAGDSGTGEYGAINVDSYGNIKTIAEFINNNFNIQFYGVKLSAIGLFYKPNNESKLNQLDNKDIETLVYLLRFLEVHKIIKINHDFDGLTDTVIKWNTTQI